ncbi:MAG: NYN domain-containing protein [Actinobacteria bacterium]|nr:NYN domain-containing protein [Actinomycetota bacterium]
MNVIGSRPDGWWRDRNKAKRDLVKLLEAFKESNGDEVTVVFDGAPLDALADGDRGGIEVAFATRRGPNAADDEIHRRVRADADPSTLLVVTSDAELVANVRRAGAKVVSSGSFRRTLDKAKPDGTA